MHPQNVVLKRTTAGRSILSTCSFTLFEVLLSMIVLQAAQVLRQLSGGIASRAAAQGPVGGGSSDSPLGFPLFTMQGGPGGHLASRLALTEVIVVASQWHELRDGDRAIERRVGVRRFGEWPGTEIDVFGNFEPLRFEYFLCPL